jgi:hypothetical protein
LHFALIIKVPTVWTNGREKLFKVDFMELNRIGKVKCSLNFIESEAASNYKPGKKTAADIILFLKIR